MPIPDLVRDLREKIGQAPLWLAGATAVVIDGDRILLIRRSDSGAWTPITGIIDPGEEPAVALVREALEEANVSIEVQWLSSTWVTRPIRYENGDEARYLDLTFRCRYLGGDPRPVDSEASEVAWFPLDGMPPMGDEMAARVRHALGDEGPAFSAASPSRGAVSDPAVLSRREGREYRAWSPLVGFRHGADAGGVGRGDVGPPMVPVSLSVSGTEGCI